MIAFINADATRLPLADGKSGPGWVLYCGDCRDVMRAMPDASVDHVITDPPYSERTHTGHDASAGGHNGFGHDGSARNDLGYQHLTETDVHVHAANIERVCRGWSVVMCDHTLAPAWCGAFPSRYVFAPLPYYAPGSRVCLSGDGPSSWTVWLVPSRTAAQSRWGTLPGGYVRQPGWDKPAHMGGKPVGLMTELVRDYSRPGDTILDPFAGSGTTGVAALRMGRKFIGIELNPDYCEIAARRLEAEANAMPLFAEGGGR